MVFIIHSTIVDTGLVFQLFLVWITEKGDILLQIKVRRQKKIQSSQFHYRVQTLVKHKSVVYIKVILDSRKIFLNQILL